MKEFVMKHPILTFLLGDAAIAGVVNIVKSVCYAITGREGLAPSKVRIHVGDKSGKDEEEATVEGGEA